MNKTSQKTILENNSKPLMDPEDWIEIQQLGHRIVDDMVAYLKDIRQRPVWQKMPDDIKQTFNVGLPAKPQKLNDIYETIHQTIVPYMVALTHPKFMGWVHGAAHPVGMLAELIAAGLNANVVGSTQSPTDVEMQVIRWASEMLGLPKESSGLLVTGTSIATLIAVLTARTAHFGEHVKYAGISETKGVAYVSLEAHCCMSKAMNIAGFGSYNLRKISCDANGQMILSELAAAITYDRSTGLHPFFVGGTAGTTNTGAIDNLAALAEYCSAEKIWFHVDAAFGAFAMFSPLLREQLKGIERADSVAFDFHKWIVPYDAGCIVIRHSSTHLTTFSEPADYLATSERGLKMEPLGRFLNLGPDLSRGFRALKVWMTIKALGTDQLGKMVEHLCELAQQLAARIDAEPLLERLAPVTLNIVCFRYRVEEHYSERVNTNIVSDIQEHGIVMPSTTKINGQFAIRAALFNHRMKIEDVDTLIDSVLKYGKKQITSKL